jgi:hypothetical protein
MLVDAEDRYQQRMAEREQDKMRRGQPAADPERVRAANSLRLARAELLRQESVTENPVRREQIRQALADIDKRLAEL